MNNLQSNVKKLRIAVYALVVVSLFNLVMLFLRAPETKKTDVLWQESAQIELQHLQEAVQELETNISTLKSILPQASQFSNTMEGSLQSSIALILANIQEKQQKFEHLNKKISDLSRDISTLKKQFSSMASEK